VLTTKQVSKNEIHAACVNGLAIEKITWLQHLNFCNFTLWMPPCLGCPPVLDARGRRPVCPSLCTPLCGRQVHLLENVFLSSNRELYLAGMLTCVLLLDLPECGESNQPLVGDNEIRLSISHIRRLHTT